MLVRDCTLAIQPLPPLELLITIRTTIKLRKGNKRNPGQGQQTLPLFTTVLYLLKLPPIHQKP